ncbi:MAG: hypothetical protein A2958_02860 [Candidatus Levybacteria bacterium RIFCSPLOWO2_01_FULL_38_13]|nr:MAG: hypothetical protein A2629_03275 [Candidatus Levybacteria bacterium RIFCSPHIGHO2_01_FULL_41_15]OGH35277.1 MAG: hypothetical protein A2958_02860 [Candidatus Levybacteria bacterium RIFCSPLOWO2_01_FULL_38_13]
MARFEQAAKTLKEILLNNFLGGLAWAIGATVGISIIIFLLTNVFRNVGWIPFIGDFISNLTSYVLTNLQSNPQLVK